MAKKVLAILPVLLLALCSARAEKEPMQCYVGSSSSKTVMNCTEGTVNCFIQKKSDTPNTYACGDNEASCKCRWGPEYQSCPCTGNLCNVEDDNTTPECNSSSSLSQELFVVMSISIVLCLTHWLKMQ